LLPLLLSRLLPLLQFLALLILALLAFVASVAGDVVRSAVFLPRRHSAGDPLMFLVLFLLKLLPFLVLLGVQLFLLLLIFAIAVGIARIGRSRAIALRKIVLDEQRSRDCIAAIPSASIGRGALSRDRAC